MMSPQQHASTAKDMVAQMPTTLGGLQQCTPRELAELEVLANIAQVHATLGTIR